jgi:hypothetical protein
MNEFEVTCITKSTTHGSCEHITEIGGHSGGGWRLSKEAAIHQIENKIAAFFTVDRATNRKVYVAVVREPGKAPYLRTHADGKWNDNLLAQTSCPISFRRVA